MKVEQVLHMAAGAGDGSYSSNSRLQEKGILLIKPMVVNAVEEIMVSKKAQYEAMVVADLGCSSGSNTLSFVAQVLDAIGGQCQRLGKLPPEVLFFLNDLPANDFNCLFRSLEKFKEERMETLTPYYIAGVPGSFYSRLFPTAAVDLFHSNYSLHWLSQVPEGLEDERRLPLNKQHVNIAHPSPPEVVKAYQKQYQRDFSAFLRCRYEELRIGGEMVLNILGRESRHPADGDLSCLFGLLADALKTMVFEGKIDQDKVDTFNVPVYGPSMEEVKSIVVTEGLFDLKREEVFKSSWDPYVDSMDDVSLDKVSDSGRNAAESLKVVLGPLIAHQFGHEILDELFSLFANNISHHFLQEQTMYALLVVVLKKLA